MKIVLFILLFFCIFTNQLNAQQLNNNPLISEDFWQTSTIEDVKIAIKNGHNVNDKSYLEDTPIIYAIKYAKNPDIIDLLVAHGADVDYKNNIDPRSFNIPMCSYTPLICAIKFNKLDIIKSLIKNNADVNLIAYYTTPLDVAYEFAKDFEIISLIKANGGKNNSKEAPLNLAAKYNRNENIIIAMLEEISQNEAFKDILDETLLNAAKYNKNPKVIKAIIKYTNNQLPINKKNENILMLAIQNNYHLGSVDNNKNVIAEILKQDIDINSQNYQGKTALMFAIENLKKAIRAKDSYDKGSLAIDGAFNYSSFDKNIKNAKELVILLIENSANINIRDKEGMNPILDLDSNILKELNILNKLDVNPIEPKLTKNKDKKSDTHLSKNTDKVSYGTIIDSNN